MCLTLATLLKTFRILQACQCCHGPNGPNKYAVQCSVICIHMSCQYSGISLHGMQWSVTVYAHNTMHIIVHSRLAT